MNKRIIGRAALVAACLVTGTACITHGLDQAGSTSSSTELSTGRLPACVGSVILIDESDSYAGCDLTPPQRLDMVIHVSGTDQSIEYARGVCDEAGGDDLNGSGAHDEAGNLLLTCEGVDY